MSTKTCTQCHQTKPLTSFYKRKQGTRDGREGRCRDCKTIQNLERRKKLLANRPATKHCPNCDTTKPQAEFAKDASRSDGLSGRCKTCRMTAQQTSQAGRDEFVEDYTFLREQHMDHKAIAAHMGKQSRDLGRLLQRYDCRIMEPAEQACWDRIMLCVERGKRFSVHDMPLMADETDFLNALNVALWRGVVRRVPGKFKHPLGHRGVLSVVYEGCE